MTELTTDELIERLAWHRLHKTAGIVEDVMEQMGGQMTEWQERPEFVGSWMSTEILIDGKKLPVMVSGGGVVQVNRSPHYRGKVIDSPRLFRLAVDHHARWQLAA